MKKGMLFPKLERSIVYVRVTPPSLDTIFSNGAILGVLEYEKDQHCRYGNARIERRRQNVVVLRPPRKISPPNNILEDETNNTPRNVVDSRGRRNVSSTIEEDGEATMSELNNGLMW